MLRFCAPCVFVDGSGRFDGRLLDRSVGIGREGRKDVRTRGTKRVFFRRPTFLALAQCVLFLDRPTNERKKRLLGREGETWLARWLLRPLLFFSRPPSLCVTRRRPGRSIQDDFPSLRNRISVGRTDGQADRPTPTTSLCRLELASCPSEDLERPASDRMLTHIF